VQLTGAAGFAASYAPLKVNLGGTLNLVSNFYLESSTSLADVDFQSPLNLGSNSRTITVQDNPDTTFDFATISGAISGGSAGTTLTLSTGMSSLTLTGSNTYLGDTVYSSYSGALFLPSIGSLGATSSSLGSNVGGGSLYLGNGQVATWGYLNLVYIGAGEVTTRPIVLNVTNQTINIDSSGSGPLVLSNVIASGTAGGTIRTLNLRGSNSDANMITSVLTDAGTVATSIAKSDGGVWILNPSTQNTLTGVINATGGMLGLTAKSFGAGGLTVNNGGVFAYGGSLSTGTQFVISSNNSAFFGGSNAAGAGATAPVSPAIPAAVAARG
jgi:hypothetical protein